MPCPRNAARAAPSQRVLILCTASETLGSRLSYPRSITASTSRALQPSASHAQDAVDAEPGEPEVGVGHHAPWDFTEQRLTGRCVVVASPTWSIRLAVGAT